MALLGSNSSQCDLEQGLLQAGHQPEGLALPYHPGVARVVLPHQCPKEKPSSLLNDDFAIQPRGGLKESNKLPVCISDARWSMAAAGRNHTVQLLLLPERKLQNHCLLHLTGKEAALALLEGEVTKLQSKCGSFKLSE